MRISVVIPTYNRIELLPRAIDSVIQQNRSELMSRLDIIVVDDGSGDQTQAELEKHYPEVIYLRQTNQGVSSARNVGINYAVNHIGSDWIALLDSDDEWLPDKLLNQCALLAQTTLLVCHTEEMWVRNGVRVNQMKKHQKQGGWIFQQCLPLCAMSPSSIMLHRDVFARVGLFDEALPACEDYDLWLRISAIYEIAYLQQASIIKYGGHPDQLSRQYWGMDRFRVIALEKILSAGCLNQIQFESARAMLIKKLTILLNGANKHQNQFLSDECADKLARWQQ